MFHECGMGNGKKQERIGSLLSRLVFHYPIQLILLYSHSLTSQKLAIYKENELLSFML